MAEIKDKIVSVEDLSALHKYNKTTYMPIGATAADIGAYSKDEVYTKTEVDALIKTAIEEIMNYISSGSDETIEPTE